MMAKIYVPIDSGALSLGAGKVASAIETELLARGLQGKLVRNGSRGAYFLEPMVEVETDRGRIAYGPVTPDDVPSLFDADFLAGGAPSAVLGADRRYPVPCQADAADLRPLRRHRSAGARRLSRAWRADRTKARP